MTKIWDSNDICMLYFCQTSAKLYVGTESNIKQIIECCLTQYILVEIPGKPGPSREEGWEEILWRSSRV